MKRFLEAIGLDLLPVVLVGLLLLGLFRVLRFAVRLAPMRKERRAAMERALPLAGVVVAVSFALVVLRGLLESQPAYHPIAALLVFVGLLAISFSTLSDVMAGVALRSSHSFTVGDTLKVGDTEGRIESMGLRSVTIATTSGDRAILPYRQLAGGATLRGASVQAAVHHFALPLDEHLSLKEVRSRIVYAVMLNHWTSLTREPEISRHADGSLEVSVFTLDADRGPEVEAAVRAALSSGADSEPTETSTVKPGKKAAARA